MTLEIGDPAAELYWPALRLVDAGWCDLAGLRHLTCEDVDLANLTLDALERARHKDP